jgi:hypothetical protein
MKNAEKKSVVVLPQIEKKELTKYRVTRTARVEFEFLVYAEDSYDAENIIDDHTRLYESSDGCSVDYDSSYYDNENYVSRVDFECVNSCDWDNIDTYNSGEEETIYKFIDGDWDNEDNVFNTEEALIDDYLSRNDIDKDEVKIVKFEDAPSEEEQKEEEAVKTYTDLLECLDAFVSQEGGFGEKFVKFQFSEDSAIFPKTYLLFHHNLIHFFQIENDAIYGQFLTTAKHRVNKYVLMGYLMQFMSERLEADDPCIEQ